MNEREGPPSRIIGCGHSQVRNYTFGILSIVHTEWGYSDVEESRKAGRGESLTRMRAQRFLLSRSDDPSLSVCPESSRAHTVPSCVARQLSRVVM